MDIILRNALQTDIHDLAKIHVNSWKVAFIGLMPENYINQYTYSSRVEDWEKILKTDSETVVVAESNTNVIGFMSYSVHSQLSNTLELSKLYLCPSFYGKNLGSKFMYYLNSEAKTLGIKSINLYVLDNNESAIRFYSKHGFELSDGYLSEEFEGENITDILMTKRV